MLLGLTDTLMIGRVGTVDLAAAAFANALFYLPLAVGIGLAVGLGLAAVALSTRVWLKLRPSG